MRTKAILASMLAALVMVTSCAANGADSGAGSGDAGDSSASQGKSIDLDFSAETLDGGTYEGTQLEGKPAVLWFWAPWCPTCRAQAPNVSELATKYAGEVNVVGVGGLSDATDIRDYAKSVDGPTHLVDEEGAVWRHFGVTAQSTYVVLDADGQVVAEGYLDDGDLTAKVADLAG